MGVYTDTLEKIGYDIYPDDEEYIEELASFMKLFRSVDTALDEFLKQHGYKGNIADVESKIIFIKKQFRNEMIPVPRNIKKWYTESKRFSRKTAFQFCFAFQLNIKETENFFRRICLQRGIDCHNIEEAVYYYALSNGLNYLEAQEIYTKIPPIDVKDINNSKNILYTDIIIDELKRIKDKDCLLRFLTENIQDFSYNNATAYKYIQFLWEKISGENGLAVKEKLLLLPADKKKKGIYPYGKFIFRFWGWVLR